MYTISKVQRAMKLGHALHVSRKTANSSDVHFVCVWGGGVTPSLASHALCRVRKGLVTLQPLCCQQQKLDVTM